jgi:hypothetical protein
LAIEVKSGENLKPSHFKGLRAFAEEFSSVRKILVFTGQSPRLLEDGVEVWPVKDFLMSLCAIV